MTASPSFVRLGRRILISGGLAVGGPQTHLTHLCAVLLEAGAEVTVASASTNWTAPAIARLRAMGVRVIVSPFGFGALRSLGKIWAFCAWPILLRRDYDVLCCLGEGRMHFWAARFVARTGWKIYHELVECPSRFSVAAEIALGMDALIANSREVAAEMRAMFPAIPVRTIPFLTSGEPVTPPAPRTPVGNDMLRVAFLGRLVPHKRPDRLVESWHDWNSRAPLSPARLDIYGGDYDDEGERLCARIADLGLEKSVCLHGAYTTDDLPRILAATDLIVLPSLYEGLPLVLVEAMQRGIPVVATSAGGTRELGEDNHDVLITEGTDWNDFEQGLLEMVGRIRAGEINGTRLHQWTEERYGFHRVAAEWREALLQTRNYFSASDESLSLATEHR